VITCWCGSWYLRPDIKRSRPFSFRNPLLDEEMPVFPGLGLYFEFSPQNCLSSRRPLWTDTHPTNIISQWRDEWKSAPVVNCSLVDDSTIWQPGFGTPTHYWVLLNHFWNNQGHCAVCILSKEVGPCSN